MLVWLHITRSVAAFFNVRMSNGDLVDLDKMFSGKWLQKITLLTVRTEAANLQATMHSFIAAIFLAFPVF